MILAANFPIRRRSPGQISTVAPKTRKNTNYAAHSHSSRSRLQNERRHAETKAKKQRGSQSCQRGQMAAITTRKIEAIVHTKIDAARKRTVAKTIALDRLSAFLGDAAPALQPPALPWVDLEIRPAFREPVEICVDCPEKATESTAFKVRFPRLVRCLRGWSCLFDGVIGTISRRWRHWDDVASMASSSRDSSRVFGGDASTGVSLDVMFWMIESQSHGVNCDGALRREHTHMSTDVKSQKHT